MPDAQDMDLVREFARSASESAFAEVVRRHLNLVYSVAWRLTGNPADAQDVAQAVFIVLARQAGQLKEGTVLTGWLYRITRYTARGLQRTQARRRAREQEASMDPTLNQLEPDDPWHQLSPYLEEGMGKLSERDRTLVAMRFYEHHTAAQAATVLGIREDAVHKRTVRALEKLRRFFTRRGIALSAATIVTTLSAHSVQAAPPGLATTVTSAAVKGAAISTAIATLVKGTLNMMTWIKLKFAAGAGVVALVAGGVATIAMTETGHSDVVEVLRRSVVAYAALTSYGDEGTVVGRMNDNSITNRFSIKLARPNLYRIEWQPPAHAAHTNQGTVWSDGREDFLRLADGRTQRQPNMETALSTAAGVSGGATALVPGTFFDKDYLGSLLGLDSAALLAEEPVDGVDCYVVAKEMSGGRSQTLWIGKQDCLLRRIRTVHSAESMKAAMAEALRNNPELKTVQLPEPTETVLIETHENIVINSMFTEAGFAGAAPAGAPEDITRKRVNEAKLWSLGFRLYADSHGGQLPATFVVAQAQPRAGLQRLDTSIFEIVSTGNWNTIPDHARTVLLRERLARKDPQGGFVRVYALADGRVEVVTSQDLEFAAAEKQRRFVVRRD